MQDDTGATTEDAFRLDGQVAIITGGGQGIGAATALAFAERAGADVVVIARTATDLDTVAEEVRDRGRRAMTIPGDVNDLEGLATAVERTIEGFGRLDIVVNNAAAPRRDRSRRRPSSSWRSRSTSTCRSRSS